MLRRLAMSGVVVWVGVVNDNGDVGDGDAGAGSLLGDDKTSVSGSASSTSLGSGIRAGSTGSPSNSRARSSSSGSTPTSPSSFAGKGTWAGSTRSVESPGSAVAPFVISASPTGAPHTSNPRSSLRRSRCTDSMNRSNASGSGGRAAVCSTTRGIAGDGTANLDMAPGDTGVDAGANVGADPEPEPEPEPGMDLDPVTDDAGPEPAPTPSDSDSDGTGPYRSTSW
jgi:hypothetical protein